LGDLLQIKEETFSQMGKNCYSLISAVIIYLKLISPAEADLQGVFERYRKSKKRCKYRK